MYKICSNLHTHTVYSDGISTAEEYVLAAIEKGFVSIGFSEHSHTPYDTTCCVSKEDMPRYVAEIRRLKEAYQGRIEVFLGLEGDYYYPTPVNEVDYFIGSVHYLRDEKTGSYYTVDYKPAIFEEAVHVVAGGSARRLVELYYGLVIDLVRNQKPDIVGHLDLITKLNRNGRYFDTGSGWYRDTTEQAVEEIAAAGCVVELNTGGMFRGYTDQPYPSLDILRRLRERSVPVTISSDAHSADGLDYWFEDAEELLRQAGFQSVVRMERGSFVEIGL